MVFMRGNWQQGHISGYGLVLNTHDNYDGQDVIRLQWVDISLLIEAKWRIYASVD